jgi:hypothetical protein
MGRSPYGMDGVALSHSEGRWGCHERRTSPKFWAMRVETRAWLRSPVLVHEVVRFVSSCR